MISIVISVCLIADPEVCKDHRVPLSIDVVDPKHCLMAAPPHFARWAEENPGWRIVKWRCGAGSSDGAESRGSGEERPKGSESLGRRKAEPSAHMRWVPARRAQGARLAGMTDGVSTRRIRSISRGFSVPNM